MSNCSLRALHISAHFKCIFCIFQHVRALDEVEKAVVAASEPWPWLQSECQREELEQTFIPVTDAAISALVNLGSTCFIREHTALTCGKAYVINVQVLVLIRGFATLLLVCRRTGCMEVFI